MRLAIEIDRWEDLITLKELLNGNGLIKLNDDLPPQIWEKGNETTAAPAQAPEKPQGTPRKSAPQKPAQKLKEEQTTAAGPDAAEDTPEAADGAAAGPVDASNPFAEDVIEEATPKKPKKLSRDDVNVAFRKYIDVFGNAAAMQDVSKLLEEGFGVKAISKIPSDQDSFAKAITMVADAIESNKYGREPI
jgi:hypothetical protein